LRAIRAGPWNLKEFEPLLTLYQKHAAAVSALATKLRLTPKSRWRGREAETEIRNAPKKALWEL
jgi:hypothetical protein